MRGEVMLLRQSTGTLNRRSANLSTDPISLGDAQAPEPLAEHVFRPKVNNILVPIDFSSASLDLVRYAVAVGELFGASIWLLHVVPCDPFTQNLRRLGLCRSHDEALSTGPPRLAELARAEIAPGLRGGTLLRVGDPVPEIIAAAKTIDADLIILSLEDVPGVKPPPSAGVAKRLLRQQPCLILTIRRELLLARRTARLPLAFHNILVPVDFTESSRSTVRWAAGFAGLLGAKITLRYAPGLLAEQPVAKPTQPAPLPTTESKTLAFPLAAWSNLPAFGPVVVDLLPEMEKPDAHILGQMLRRAESDLIVTSTPRYSWWHNLVHDPAAEQIRRVAPCPVLSVPQKDLEPYAHKITV